MAVARTLNLRGGRSPAAPALDVLAPGTTLGVRGYSRHWIAVGRAAADEAAGPPGARMKST